MKATPCPSFSSTIKRLAIEIVEEKEAKLQNLATYRNSPRTLTIPPTPSPFRFSNLSILLLIFSGLVLQASKGAANVYQTIGISVLLMACNMGLLLL